MQRQFARKVSWNSRKMSIFPVPGQVLYPGRFLVENMFDRETPTQQISRLIKSIYNIDSGADAGKKNMYPIMFASGMTGIGKTVFGEQVLIEIAKNEPSPSEFGRVLSNMNYLMVDFFGGGDNFDEKDIPLTPEERFFVRVLSRACRIPDGAYGLRDMTLKSKKSVFDAHVGELKTGGLNNVASLLIRFSQGELRLCRIFLEPWPRI